MIKPERVVHDRTNGAKFLKYVDDLEAYIDHLEALKQGQQYPLLSVSGSLWSKREMNEYKVKTIKGILYEHLDHKSNTVGEIEFDDICTEIVKEI